MTGYYCRRCHEINPPDSGAFDYTSSPSGRRRTYTPSGGPFCGACGSEDIVPEDEWRAEIEAREEGER